MDSTRTDDQQIRALLADFHAALEAKQAARVISYSAPDTVVYDLAPPLRADTDPERSVGALDAWFATFDGPMEYETRDLDVVVGGDVAYCHGLTRLTATPSGSTDSFDLWTRSTFGLQRRDGSWLITHEHTSTPFHMETTDGTFRAATDLTP
jgi:ketosteroid isomerase-like protein